jgi:hypothetical protein
MPSSYINIGGYLNKGRDTEVNILQNAVFTWIILRLFSFGLFVVSNVILAEDRKLEGTWMDAVVV